MTKYIKSAKNTQRLLKLISNRECDAEIGDNSLIIDVYNFSRNRKLHVYYSLYNSSNKSCYIVYN